MGNILTSVAVTLEQYVTHKLCMSNAIYLPMHKKRISQKTLNHVCWRMFVVGMKCDVKQRPDALREFSP
jgi:hypothetical protein